MTRLNPRYPLCSDRLRLRPLGIDDVTSLVAYRSNAEVCRYVPFEPMDATTMLERARDSWSGSGVDAECYGAPQTGRLHPLSQSELIGPAGSGASVEVRRLAVYQLLPDAPETGVPGIWFGPCASLENP